MCCSIHKLIWALFSCQRIITQDQPGPHDSHGCPFRHFSEQALLNSLSYTYNISAPVDTKELLDAVKGGHYHVACTRVYEITHRDQGVRKGDGSVTRTAHIIAHAYLQCCFSVGSGESVSHPNLYYERSLALTRPSKEKEEMLVDT